ncbi:MAG TPA: hypothetical protein VK465_08085, partial [Fibrobacteria bacterium]|nr:hypothetical protein [Fibrobacteria bacterium]
ATPNTPFPPFESDTIAGPDSTPVLITVPVSGGQFDASHRVVFRGSADKEALLVTRKNVTLRGIVFEMPTGAASVAALSIKAGGAVVDGCLFRPVSTAASASGPAVHMEPGDTQGLRFVNNVVWGYSQGIRIQSPSNAIRILHNTFIDEPQLNSTPTVGLVGAGGTLAPVVANNWFSGIDTPYVGFAGKGAVLDHNAYALPAGNPLKDLQETGTIDSVDRLSQLDLSQNDFAAQLADAVDRNMECDAFEPCNGLYAGSSSNSHGPTVATDFTGRARTGKPDIGAVDAKSDPSTVRGVLGMDVRAISASAGGHEKLAIRVTPKTYDPQDVDFVYVWWSETAATPFDGNKPVRKYPRSALDAGSIADTLTGLKSLTTYYVHAALGKVVGGQIKIGYGYTHSAMTDFKRDTSDCRFTATSLVCPATGGVFSVPDGLAKDQYFTKVTFAQPDSGTVKAPQVIYPGTEILRGRVKVFPTLPLITLTVESAALKAKGSKQSWKAEVTIKSNPIGIIAEQNLELYVLRDSASAPLFVPTWSIRAEGTDAVLTIEGHQAGTFTYAFGSQVASTQSATILQSETEQPPVFNFADSSVTSVPFKFRGTGFATGNPLVVVTPIPTAGLFTTEYQTVVGGRHKNPSLILSSGYEDVDTSIRNDRLYRYFQRAVAADAKSAAPAGRVKPFALKEISREDFSGKVLLSTPSLAISGAGEAQEVNLNLTIDRQYRNPDAYSPASGHGSNSIEVLFTVFDGSSVTRSSGYIRTRFTDADLTSLEKSQRSPGKWNLFAFPWDEAESRNLNHVMMDDPDASWEPSKRRIMRYKGSGSGEAAFETYNGTNASAFKYDEGRAIWSASADFYTPRPIAATSLDYKPFKLELTAGQWNDFGLPFNFPIKWTDILAANPTWPRGIKVWRYVPDKLTWEPLLAEPDKTQSVVHPWDGLTVFPAAGQFPAGSAPSLIIPVLDSSRSAAPMVPTAKIAAGQAHWTAKVIAYNSTAAMGLWIGVQDREDAFGKAPEVPGQDFRLYLKEQAPQGDQLVSGLHRAFIGDWQGHWALQGSANGEGIRLRAGENPREIPLYLVEALSGKVTALSPNAEAALSPEDLRTGDYHLVAGDSRYLKGVLDGLVPLHMLDLSNYPNPFTSATLIRYALPDSYGKAEFRLKVRDSRGRLVWEREFRGSN